MSRRRTSDLAFAAFLALAFMVISLLPAITGGLWGRFGEQALNSALSEPIWRMRLGLNIALFALALAALHLGFGLLCWLLAVASAAAWPSLDSSRRQWIVLWFIAGCFWLFTANATYFPNSALGFPYHELVVRRVLGVPLHVLVTTVLGATVALVLALALCRSAACRRAAMALTAIGAIITATAALPHGRIATASVPGRPDVILIGIDSLRADGVDAEHTPNLQQFLAGATRMPDAMTPLARTFPSWVSILTGRQPHTTGAWMNLLPRDSIHTGQTLPDTLRARGYRATYAIDETRFSNVDASYGFDQTVTPSIGASDFVIGTFADVPLSNLIVNTRLGGWLFPQLHANRAAYLTYEPDSFVRRLDRELRFDQPLFLAVHFTLPHWPYTWASSSLTPKDGSTQRGHYLNTVRRVDAQFAALLATLQRHGALENALVVVLSDHGQALGRKEDFLEDALPEKGRDHIPMESEGHGTSVLSPSQYRVVLAFRGFGPARSLLPPPGTVDAPVSLIDIAPTVLDLLKVPAPEPFDGLSLAPLFQPGVAPGQAFADRIRFTETEYGPRGFSEANLTGGAVAEAARAYRVDPVTDRITVRLEQLDQILEYREYAAVLGNRVLAAAMPGMRKDGRRQLLFISHPFEPDATREAVGTADRERLKEALQRTFPIDLADPEPSTR